MLGWLMGGGDGAAKHPAGDDPELRKRLDRRKPKLKLVRKIAAHGSGPVQQLAKLTVEDQSRLETIIRSLRQIPDVHDQANRVLFAAMSEVRRRGSGWWPP